MVVRFVMVWEAHLGNKLTRKESNATRRHVHQSTAYGVNGTRGVVAAKRVVVEHN